MKVSVVVPLYNEDESLPVLLQKIHDVFTMQKLDWEVLCVDDGSTDSSFAVLQQLAGEYGAHVKVLRFSRNYGKSAALSVGIAHATGEVIVTMDADLQDDPEAIPQMLQLLEQGWDLVSGWKKKRNDPLSKTLPSKVYNFLTSSLSGLKLHDFNCGFKAYRAQVAKNLEIYGDRHRFLPVLAHWDGFRVTEMAVPHHARQFGKSKFGIGRASGMFDLLTLLFLRKYMRKPLHFFGLLGFGLIFLGTLIMGYFGVEWLIIGESHIRPLILVAMGALIMGVQFISLGLIGEMIANATHSRSYSIRDTIHT